jgi:hypothetical protein
MAAFNGWPVMRENNDLIVVRHPLLMGAFGSMDGLNLAVQTSADQEIENATYNKWLHEHLLVLYWHLEQLVWQNH